MKRAVYLHFREHYGIVEKENRKRRMKRGKMKFRKAKQDDKEEILALYQSLIGTPYCAWGNGYPGEQEFDYDMKRNALFVWKMKMEKSLARSQWMKIRRWKHSSAGPKHCSRLRSFPDSGYAPICRIRELPGSFCNMAWKN